ncbi:MAG: hypothetical protein WKG07_01115 [Hymenobacter sp.]
MPTNKLFLPAILLALPCWAGRKTRSWRATTAATSTMAMRWPRPMPTTCRARRFC